MTLSFHNASANWRKGDRKEAIDLSVSEGQKLTDEANNCARKVSSFEKSIETEKKRLKEKMEKFVRQPIPNDKISIV